MDREIGQRGRWVIGVGLVLALGAAGFALVRSVPEPPERPAAGGEEAFQAYDEVLEPVRDEPVARQRAAVVSHETVATAAAAEPERGEEETPGPGESIREDDEASVEVAEEIEEEERVEDREYDDPVHQQVLGSRRWMAELPEEEQAAIDAVFDEPLDDSGFGRETFEARGEAIARAREVAVGCYAELQGRWPGRTGRVIVAFHLVGDGATARLRAPTVLVNVDLDDPLFEQCLVTRLAGLRFPSDGLFSHRVEYPFFFE